MTNYSPNMLKTFQSCPLKYKFKYIDKISLPQKASFFEKGKKVHALANYYLQGIDITKLEPTLNEAETQAWQTLKANEYFNKTYINSEYNLSCKIGNYWIGGRLDAIVKEQNTYYILDYKTGSIPQKPEYDYQTMVYLLCLANSPLVKANDTINFVYIDLKNNKNCVIDFSNEKKSEYENAILKICSNIENAQFSEGIEHSQTCDFCEFKKLCH